MDFTMTGHGVSVQFKVLRMGTDCLVLAAGGDTGHIGAIAFGDRGECLSNAREGHREGVVTELIYRELESVVSGGRACRHPCGRNHEGTDHRRRSAVRRRRSPDRRRFERVSVRAEGRKRRKSE